MGATSLFRENTRHLAVLPDGIFSNQKSQFGYIFEGLSMVDVGIFMVILSTLQPNGIFYVHLVHFLGHSVYFSRFGMFYREKSGNPDDKTRKFGTTAKLQQKKFCPDGP
jgi:hypothetical protein